MKIVYIANDGKQFDNEYDCEAYEFFSEKPYVLGISYYDEFGNLLDNDNADNYFNNILYDNSWKVIIHNENELEDFKNIVLYCGWYEMRSIDEVGTWEYDIDNSTFVKKE